MAEIITKDRKEYHIWDKINGVWNRLNFLTSASSVDASDGKDLQTKVGSIDGITDSLTAASSNIALSTKGASDMYNEINSNLTATDNTKFRFATDGEGNYGYLGADDSFIPFSSRGAILTSAALQDNYFTGGYGATVTFSVTGLKKIFIEYWCNQTSYHKLGYKANGATDYSLTNIMPANTHQFLTIVITDDSEPVTLVSYCTTRTSTQSVYVNVTSE